MTEVASGHDSRACDQTRRIPGEPGLWIFIFGDLVVFAVLFGVFLHARGAGPELFRRSQDTLNRDYGAVNTLVLLLSSMLVVLASRALNSEAYQRLAPRLVLGAIGCGLVFVGVKVVEYHEMINEGLTPAVNSFYMYYFVLTGLHLFHLLLGMGVLTVMFSTARDTPATTAGRRSLFEGGACFWHMVDLLWIVIFPVVFLVRS